MPHSTPSAATFINFNSFSLPGVFPSGASGTTVENREIMYLFLYDMFKHKSAVVSPEPVAGELTP